MSFKNLSYLSSLLLHKDGDSNESIQTYYQTFNYQTLLTLKYRGLSGVVSQYILQSGSLWHTLSSSFKTNVWFLSMTVQLGVGNNDFN